MDTEELDRNSDDDQLRANHHPAPTEHTVSRSRNGTGDESTIEALNSDLSPPQAVTSSTEDHNITQVEAPNHTLWENARQHELQDEHPSREEIQDEHPIREESNPMLDANAMYVAIVDQPPIEESGDEHDERHPIVSIMPL